MSLLLAAVAVGCGEGEATSLGTGGAAGGAMTAGGDGGATATTTFTPPVTTSMTTGSPAGGAGGADPSCPEGSLYALSDINLDGEVVSMCKYRGDVLLIVNTAEA